MPFHNILRLPMLVSVLLLQLILSPPTSSFSLSPTRRRIWTPLQAAGNAYDEESEGRGNDASASPFEQAVRGMTGNEEYKFGDITKTVVNSTTTQVEGAVRAVTGDESYAFGDITKKAIGSTTGGVEGVMRSVTGNEEYRFGDLTRGTLNAADGLMTYSEKTLGLMRDHDIHELVKLSNHFWGKTMNYEERKEAFIVFVYLGAVLVLSYNFVANMLSGMVFAAAWTTTSRATGASPLAPGMWPKLLETQSSLDLFFGGPCLPVRAIVTIPLFFKYRKFVRGLARNSPLREKFPIINRCMSLIVSWVVANLAFVGCITFGMIKLLSFWTGVPFSP